MSQQPTAIAATRREFLKTLLPSGALLCLGCSHFLAVAQAADTADVPAAKHKFLEDSGMSLKEAYQFAFQTSYIPTLKAMADRLGNERFIELLKEAASEAAADRVQQTSEALPRRDLETFKMSMKNPDPFLARALTLAIVEDTPRSFEINVTECLWATTFREVDAAELGYAGVCHADYAIAAAFNSKIRLIRTKTLMQGHACCNHRWVW